MAYVTSGRWACSRKGGAAGGWREDNEQLAGLLFHARVRNHCKKTGRVRHVIYFINILPFLSQRRDAINARTQTLALLRGGADMRVSGRHVSAKGVETHSKIIRSIAAGLKRHAVHLHPSGEAERA